MLELRCVLHHDVAEQLLQELILDDFHQFELGNKVDKIMLYLSEKLLQDSFLDIFGFFEAVDSEVHKTSKTRFLDSLLQKRVKTLEQSNLVDSVLENVLCQKLQTILVMCL
jgi:hypothetical protein